MQITDNVYSIAGTVSNQTISRLLRSVAHPQQCGHTLGPSNDNSYWMQAVQLHVKPNSKIKHHSNPKSRTRERSKKLDSVRYDGMIKSPIIVCYLYDLLTAFNQTSRFRF